MRTMTMSTAKIAGQHNNAHYPNRYEVTTVADLEAVVRLDHVVAEYQGGRRSSANFLRSDCLVMNVDNSHTDNPEEWVTPESLADRLPQVVFMAATSRNHMRVKGAQSARARFHVYFLIDPITDASEYAELKKQLAACCELFDRKAARCHPPLPEVEVEAIWRSATRFTKTVESEPGYLPPNEYEASPVSVQPGDYSDVGQVQTLKAAYPETLRYSEATDCLIYYAGVGYESTPSAQDVAQELTERQLAKVHELLEAAKDQMAATGPNTVLTSMSKTKAQAMFTAAQRDTFAAFEDAKGYTD